MKMNYVAIEPGVPIAYNLSGPSSEEALVICHGLGGYHVMWEDDVEIFSRERQVLTIDLRGHGASSDVRNPQQEDYSLARLAMDVIGVIEHCGLKKVDILGNSLGGVVGLEVIKQNSNLVRSLITCGTTYKLNLPIAFVWMKKFIYWIKGRSLADYIAKKGTTNDAARPIIREMFSNVSLEVTHLIDRNIVKYDYLDVAASFDGPIVILKGELDKAINGALSSTFSRLKNKENFKIIDLPDVGHFTNLDRPIVFRTALAEALSFVSSKTT